MTENGRSSTAWLQVDDAMAALARAYDLVQEDVASMHDWYKNKMNRRGRIARAIRLAALVAFGIGGLIPICKVLLPAGSQLAGSWGDLGYIAIAVGAGLIGFDYFFGISNAYTRFVTTEMSLRLARLRFEAEWMLEFSETGAGKLAPSPSKLEQRLRDYVEVVAQLVERETQEWVAEFRSSLSELEKMGGRPGAGAGSKGGGAGPISTPQALPLQPAATTA